MEQWGIEFAEDRDNFDYLFFRQDLAELSGKKFHKKRNLVNAFTHSYTCEERPLKVDLIPHAMEVLDRWKLDKGSDGDYAAAREALELFGSLKMRGALYYVDGKPVGGKAPELVEKLQRAAVEEAAAYTAAP
jgi:hypothetical protein